MGDVVALPSVRVERTESDARAVLRSVFNGKVDDKAIEALLLEIHKRGMRLVPLNEAADE